MAWKNMNTFAGTIGDNKPALLLLPNGLRIVGSVNAGDWKDASTGQSVAQPIAYTELEPLPEAFNNRIAFIAAQAQVISELAAAPLEIDETGVAANDAVLENKPLLSQKLG